MAEKTENGVIPTLIRGYSPRTYRRASNASYAIGIVGLLLATVVGRPIPGTVIFVLGTVGGLAIPALSDRGAYDERDEELMRIAGSIVNSILSIGGLAVFVSLLTLEELGRVTLSSEFMAVFYAWCAYWLFWGATYIFVRIRA